MPTFSHDENPDPIAQIRQFLSGDGSLFALLRLLRSPSCDAMVLDYLQRHMQSRTQWVLSLGVANIDAKVIWCPPGQFLMGASDEETMAFPDEKPQHEVTLTRGFWLWETPITQHQFSRVMGYLPEGCAEGSMYPVNHVTWHESAAFCNALSDLMEHPSCFHISPQDQGHISNSAHPPLLSDYAEGQENYYLAEGWRLPTEAEWEYACLANTPLEEHPPFETIAWYDKNAKRSLHPVKQKQPNPWGFYDMLGNVWEWVFDAWTPRYPKEAQVDPIQNHRDNRRVRRGGGWNSQASLIRSTTRLGPEANYHGTSLGFRPALSMPIPSIPSAPSVSPDYDETSEPN